VMFGGIMLSAVLTFFVVPAAFFLFERKRVEKMEANGKTETEGDQEPRAIAAGET